MLKPGYIQAGETCRTDGYRWLNSQNFCWRLNWHIPVSREGLIVTDDVIKCFRQGIVSYSFLTTTCPCEIPVFIFKFPAPINYWYAALNARKIYPESLFHVLQDSRKTINLLLIDKNRVLISKIIEIDIGIMELFLHSVRNQAKLFYTEKEYLECNKILANSNPAALYLKGTKKHQGEA